MTTAASQSHDCTVLFADLAGSTQLYERIGDAVAFKLIEQCLQGIRCEILKCGGRVVKHTGDGLMAVFHDANDAPDAAIRIHNVVQDLPRASGQKLAVRVAFHTGTVIQSKDDVFGDTVNVAARLLELASPGRAITSAETVRQLKAEWRTLLHPLQSRSLRGVSRLTALFELVCESAGDLTVVQSVKFDAEDSTELRLKFRSRSLILNTQIPSARLGRAPSSDVRVSDTRASREHAYIELRGDKFVLVDRSSNGTFVTIDDEREFVLSHEEVVLRKWGHLALGRSCVDSTDVIDFICL
ncbi:adenylate/guanylate cyclase domain-containing protein [Aromatoleum diolicum]|uniref:FHA domain-containing protein n=1 Tax=Aromatoleum diolicum TaxID=75796 RepID=A0ABX1QCB0_9RHOO|nr:adenylate/guanylate cyclase domain-containing protein [Aromatoleum diolicum]NMG76028.1 FHA domain-containing protein [Aromatoleum diolicum]